MDVLVSAHAFERFGGVFGPAGGDDVRWLEVDADTSIDPDAIEVGWMSADLFYSGLLDRFFGLLRDAPGLRWVQSAAAGTDGPWFSPLIERGIRLSTSHVNDVPIAEYVLAMVLRHYQRPDEWAAAQAERAWRHHEFREISGTTWLIVGLGAIGRGVAERARPFGTRVIGVRRGPDGTEPVDVMVGPDDVPAALPEADVVVLSRPGDAAEPPIVDAAFLAAMKPGAVLVNVARGSLVDEPALLAALDAGIPEHAILDVFATEPLPPDSALWHHPRVTVTPHSANGGTGRYRRAAELFAENLANYRAGRPLRNEVA